MTTKNPQKTEIQPAVHVGNYGFSQNMHDLVFTVAWLQPLKLSVFEDENLGNGLNHNFISYQPSTMAVLSKLE